MAGGMDLLRLLEPAVRPDGVAGPRSTPKVPIESRDFDSILVEAKSANETTSAGQTNVADEAKVIDPLKALARVDRIDNAALLKFIGSDRA